MEISTLGLTLDLIYHDKRSFDDLSQQALAMGVERFTHDLTKKEIRFYGPSDEVFSHPLLYDFIVPPPRALDCDRVAAALKAVDHGQITKLAFTQEVANAGVVFVYANFKAKKILYLSRDCDSYVETWQ